MCGRKSPAPSVTTEDVVRWMERTGKFAFTDIFYHQMPQYWVTDLLISDALRRGRSESQLIDLRSRILDLFNDAHHYEFPGNTDWRPYHAKVELLFDEYAVNPDS